MHKKENVGEQYVFTLDSFDNGVVFGEEKIVSEDVRDQTYLRVSDNFFAAPLRSRYLYSKSNPLQQLEAELIKLSKRGILQRSTIYFGVHGDIFLPFNGRFDATLRCLTLFERYTPGLLVVQTRSPLLVIALPQLKKIGKHLNVTYAVETCEEESVVRYTPGMPPISDRLKAATALRRFGIEVSLQVAPLLPYGDWRKDAPHFAAVLKEHADYIHVVSLSDGAQKGGKKLPHKEVITRLATERRFHWLRADATSPLVESLQRIAPEKLERRVREHEFDKQLRIFAA